MKVRVALVLAGTAAGLAACGLFSFEERPPWRDAAEARCLADPAALAHASFTPRRAIDGPGICGLEHPLRVSALLDGSVAMAPQPTLGCPMVAGLQIWLTRVVQPAAMQDFGEPVASLKVAAAYGCRSRDNIRGARLSEHAFGNAIDISAFVLQDGREVVVRSGWNGAPEEAAFLRAVHGGACGIFTTVLGPGADRYHTDHIHLDLAHHNASATSHFCQPSPQQDAEHEGVPMSYAPRPLAPAATPPAPRPAYGYADRGPTTAYSPPRRPFSISSAAADPFAITR
ncbi:MAG TPA: extensin family protein [Hyphomicrobiales bacterium]|nr:extensin family protein [Hyphomicrobiales bacterium]